MFGADEPVPQHGEESVLLHIGGRIQVSGKRAHGLLVDLEKKSVLAPEMLKDRTLRDAQFGRDVADSRGMVTLLGKVARGHVNDAGALGFRSRTHGWAAHVPGRTRHTASYATHI